MMYETEWRAGGSGIRTFCLPTYVCWAFYLLSVDMPMTSSKTWLGIEEEAIRRPATRLKWISRAAEFEVWHKIGMSDSNAL